MAAAIGPLHEALHLTFPTQTGSAAFFEIFFISPVTAAAAFISHW